MRIDIPNSLLKKVGVGFLIVGVIAGITVSVLASRKTHTTELVPSANLQSSYQSNYQYSYLEDKCSTGLNNYRRVGSEIDAEAEKVKNDAEQEAASVRKSNEANIAALTEQWNYYRNQALAATDDWVINTTTQIMVNFADKIVQAQNDVNTKPAAIVQAATAYIDKLSASRKIVTDREARLSACIDAVNRKQNFTVSEVSEIESFVASSNSKP